jgi:ATP-binding cassette subfamily B protein
VAQDNMSDCGIACLLMILKTYGGNVSKSMLRSITKTNKMGTNAFSLIEGAKELGLEARGFRCKDLEQISSFPCIAHVIINGTYHHYIVIRSINKKKKRVIISDPANGNKTLNYNEFNQIWSKIIITFKQSGPITKVNPNRKLVSFLINIIRPHTKKISLVVILSLFIIVLNIINTLYLKIIVDQYGQAFSDLYYLFLFFVMVVLLKIIADYIRNRLLIFINRQVDQTLIIDTYQHLISLPYSYFSNCQTGDIMARINDLSYVRELISRASIVLLVDFCLVIFALLMLYYINVILFIIVVIVLILYLIIVYFYSSKIKNYITQNQAKRGSFYAYLVETINGIETIKNLGIKSNIKKRVSELYSDLLKNNYCFERLLNQQIIIKDLIIGLGFNTILFIGSIFNSYQQITIGEIILFNSLLIYFLEPIKSIFDAEPLFRSAFNALKRVLDIYEVENRSFNGHLNTLEGDIKICNLSFSYDNINSVFNNLNLEIKAQSKVLITGASGSGKSTLAKILSGYYQVETGFIQIGNDDINDYNKKAFQNSICYVSQNEFLFSNSIHYNLVLDRLIEKERVEQIKELTQINEMLKVKKIDDSFLITENGMNISGGERQKIIIARSLLKDANIYIFDEITNEMNIELERHVLMEIFKKFNNKTIIVISHRDINSDLFDQVINFK